VIVPPEEIARRLGEQSYIADRGLATVLSVALALEKPLLLEGEAGVGKTELAKALATILETRLIRLQCYEGIDVAHALYDWNYARQMLYIRTVEAGQGAVAETIHDVFGSGFLLRRPLLEAIDHDDPSAPVLLIDEIDRADDEFEAFLLELLSDFQITIPEVGTIAARQRPIVVLTSNRTRDLHDALKRRCLYHWIAHPSVEREVEIVRLRVPAASQRLAEEAAAFVARLRSLDVTKAPGIAETLDWVGAMAAMGGEGLEAELVDATLGAVVKYHEDLELIRETGVSELIAASKASGASVRHAR
jgi:MoxR-like ATPase